MAASRGGHHAGPHAVIAVLRVVLLTLATLVLACGLVVWGMVLGRAIERGETVVIMRPACPPATAPLVNEELLWLQGWAGGEHRGR